MYFWHERHRRRATEPTNVADWSVVTNGKKRIQAVLDGGFKMKKPVLSIGNLLATAGVLFVGYVFFSTLPDVRRYIRISTM
jgi:hypothetical protein